MNDPGIHITEEEAKDITAKIENELRSADEPLSLEQLAERLQKPVVKVEKCADRLLEAGRIKYIPSAGGKWGFTHGN